MQSISFTQSMRAFRTRTLTMAVVGLLLNGWAHMSFAGEETMIRGIVRDAQGRPLPGVQLYMRGSQTIEATDDDGRFTLRTTETGPQVLVAFAPGFWSLETVLDLDGTARDVELVMEPARVAETVEVAAAVPEDAVPSVQAFRPLDVVQLPGAQADVMRYVQNLAGVNQINEEAGLIVRGGDPSEVLTMLDNAVLYHPYRYETVTGGIRGTVDPFLTSGIAFSSGGFPARFGNTLSGVLEMRGLDRPETPAGQASLLLTGVSASVAVPVRGAGVRASGNWSETRTMFRMNRSPRAFTRYPDSWDVNGSAHYDSSALGSFKVFGMSLRERVGIEVEREAYRGFVESANANELAYVRWEKTSPSGWRGAATFGASDYRSDTHVGVLDLQQGDRRLSWRAEVSRFTSAGTVRLGTDGSRLRTSYAGQAPATSADYGGARGASSFDVVFDDLHAGSYVELEGAPGVLVPNLGIRLDRFHGAAALTVDPRASLLIRTGDAQLLRVAWGIYRQAPRPYYYELFDGSVRLSPMKAHHWIAAYEYGSVGDSLQIKAEAYLKRYANLPLDDPVAGLSSAGYGSAHGIDLSVRKRMNRFNLEAVYGWLRAKRRWTSLETFGRFELPRGTWTPYFGIPHGFRATLEAELTETVTVSGSWRTASGRPFTPVVEAQPGESGFIPVYGVIHSDRVPRYERLDLNLSVLAPFGNAGTILFVGVTNALGRHNVLDYAYSSDYSERRAVTSALPRAIYFGSTVLFQ